MIALLLVVAQDLSGEWFLGGTRIEIAQEGERVTATFASIGPNPYGIADGDTVFTGTLADGTIAGTVTVRAKVEHAPGLTTTRPISLTLSEDGEWLRGRYEIEAYDPEKKRWKGWTRSSYVALRREPCREERRRLDALRREADAIAAELDPIDTEINLRRVQLELLVEHRERLRAESAGIVDGGDVTLEDVPLRREESRAQWRAYRERRDRIEERRREAWRRYRAGEITVGDYQRIGDEVEGDLRQNAESLMDDWKRTEDVDEIRRRALDRRSDAVREAEAEMERVRGEREAARARKAEVLARLEAIQAEIAALEAAYQACVEHSAREDCADWERRFAEAAEAYQRDFEQYREELRTFADDVNAWIDAIVEALREAELHGDRFLHQYENVLDFNNLVNMSTEEIEAFMGHVDTVDNVMAFVSLAGLAKRLALRAGNRLAAGKLDDMIDLAYRRFAGRLPRTARALERLRAANSSVTNAYRMGRTYLRGDPARWDVTSDALQATMRRLAGEGVQDLGVIPSGSSAQVAEYMMRRDPSILRNAARDPYNPYRGASSDIDVQFSYRRPDFSQLRGAELTAAIERDRLMRDRIVRIFEEEFTRASGGIPPSAMDVTVFGNPGLTRAVSGDAVSRLEGTIDTLFNRPNPEAYVSRGSLWMQMMMDRTNARMFRQGANGWEVVDQGSDAYRNFFRHADPPGAADAYGGFLENAFKVEHYLHAADPIVASKKAAKYYMRAEYMRMMADPTIRRVIDQSGDWASRLRDMDPHDFVTAFAQHHPELVGPANAARIALAGRLKAGERLFDDPEMARHFIEDTMRHLRNESPALGRAAEDALAAMDDAAQAGHVRAMNDMMLAGQGEDAMRALGLSDDAIRAAARMADQLEGGPPIFRRILQQMRAQADALQTPIGILPGEVVRAIGAIGRLFPLPPIEELPSIEWWLLEKAWTGITSPFRSVAELMRFFTAGLANKLYGDELQQELMWLSDHLKKMNAGMGQSAYQTNLLRNDEKYRSTRVRDAFRALSSADRPEYQLLNDLETHIRQHGPDPCLIRLRDAVRVWLDETAELRRREQTMLDAMDDTLRNMREACDLIWDGLTQLMSSNSRVIDLPVFRERILEPPILVNVETGQEWIRAWRESFEAQRGLGADEPE